MSELSPELKRIVTRAATEIWDGCYVNLGIGLPSQILPYIDKDIHPMIQSENGVLGIWQQAPRDQMDPMLIDAGGSYVSTLEGCSFFDSAISFAMIRSQRIDLCMLGAFEVDAQGDLANWKIPKKFIPGIGGAMELAQSTRNLIVLMTHLDKYGHSKIKHQCTLPITAKNCVKRIITDSAVIDCTKDGLLVIEMAEGMNQEQLIAITDAPLSFSDRLGVF